MSERQQDEVIAEALEPLGGLEALRLDIDEELKDKQNVYGTMRTWHSPLYCWSIQLGDAREANETKWHPKTYASDPSPDTDIEVLIWAQKKYGEYYSWQPFLKAITKIIREREGFSVGYDMILVYYKIGDWALALLEVLNDTQT